MYNKNFEKINIRGVNFANITMDEAVGISKGFISEQNRTRVIYTPNAEITQSCIDDKTGDLYKIINSADIIIPDGAGVVLASKILKTPLKQKVAGIELAYNLIDYLNETGGRLFLLGATPESVRKAAGNLKSKHKNLKVFERHGYFDRNNPEENQEVIAQINASEADVVAVCFGAPEQEKWIFNNKSKIKKGLLIGLGGTIDIIAGVKKYAPEIFIRLNLEWLYYYIKYPARRKRFGALPKFILGTVFRGKKY
ncbi:MAG: WecB/TagA/CpsF family glycosyltransferase [Oscillospiraceae bacterium]|nr:WecB/TagA/CpsF family glycosyltransferase [Oscillospiraceae bacterium]